MPQPSQSVTAPPNLQPFFDDMSDNESQSNFLSLKVTPPRPPPPLMAPLHHVMLETSLTFLLVSFSFLFIPSGQREAVCPLYDRHTLFTPPSPKPNTSLPTQRSKVCPSACLSVRLSVNVALFLSVPPFSILASRTELCAHFTLLRRQFENFGGFGGVALVLELLCDSVGL